MRLEGSLDAFSLPDIFALLSMTKKTGGLHLRRPHAHGPGAHGVVWFTTGSLTGGASDVARQGLARRVVGAGLADADALAGAVEKVIGDAGLGVVRALQQNGAVDEGALHDLASEHVIDTIFDLLRWPDGDFEFVVDETNPDDVGVSRAADEVVSEARRRLETWANVATTIPSPQAVLSVAPTLGEDPHLTREEWALLSLVDGRRTVAHIVGLAGRGEYAVVSALAELVSRGLLRLGATDQMSALMRAHELLASLETGVVAAPAPDAEEAPAAQAADPVVDDAVEENDDDDDDEDEPVDAPVLTAVPSQPRAEITPKRPEPFLPQRQPDHPEEPMPAVAAVAGGAATPAPAAASYIERDPAVNKSLLLRLIAGVRGL